LLYDNPHERFSVNFIDLAGIIFPYRVLKAKSAGFLLPMGMPYPSPGPSAMLTGKIEAAGQEKMT
jgi:hypothetical protein